MWKWIVGVLVVILMLVAGTCYWGIKRLTAGGNTAQVTIKQSPERIFVMLTDPDSMLTWSSSGLQLIPPRKGQLQSGDTLSNSRSGLWSPGGTGRETVTRWLVREVRPPVLFVIDGLLPPDSAGKSRVAFSRRDSLVAMGDSTRVFSTFAAPVFSDLRKTAGDSGAPAAGGSMGILEKVIASGFRAAMELDFQRLKTRLERP